MYPLPSSHIADVICELRPGLLVVFGTLLALYLIVFLFTLAIGGPSAVAGSALVVAFGKYNIK